MTVQRVFPLKQTSEYNVKCHKTTTADKQPTEYTTFGFSPFLEQPDLHVSCLEMTENKLRSKEKT